MTAASLASMRPLVQSVVVSSAQPEERGRVFAKVGFVGHVGGFIGAGMSTAFSNSYVFEQIRGWRFVFMLVGACSIFLSVFIMTLYKNGSQGEYAQLSTKQQPSYEDLELRKMVETHFDSDITTEFGSLTSFSNDVESAVVAEGTTSSLASLGSVEQKLKIHKQQ